MRDVEFENDALVDFLDWEKTDKKIFSKKYLHHHFLLIIIIMVENEKNIK